MHGSPVISIKRRTLRRWRFGLLGLTVMASLGFGIRGEWVSQMSSLRVTEPIWINGELLSFTASVEWVGDRPPAYARARFSVSPVSATNPLASTQLGSMEVEAFDPPYHVRLVRSDGSRAPAAWMDFSDTDFGLRWRNDGRGLLHESIVLPGPTSSAGEYSAGGLFRVIGRGVLVALAPAAVIVFFIVLLTNEAWYLRAGRCHNCGYDLRGGSGMVCPECGAGAGSV